MKYLNYSIIYLMLFVFLCACKFTDSAQTEYVRMDESSGYTLAHCGDSITVDTIIGDFKIFYRVSEHADTVLTMSSCNEGASTQDMLKIDRSVLLNIQRTDTTSLVTYEYVNVDDFECVVSNARGQGYLLESFSLKEVGLYSIIFEAKLCMFGTDICKVVDIFIDKNGKLNYFLVN